MARTPVIPQREGFLELGVSIGRLYPHLFIGNCTPSDLPGPAIAAGDTS